MALKQELRLATVIYGGASLAVYMHGVIKELHKLVRASKLVHNPSYALSDYTDADSEHTYVDLLQAINRHTDLRIVIDVVSGASAGAINGIMLAKALANDLSLDGQTELFLDKADIEELAAGSVGRWGGWYLKPLDRLMPLLLPRALRNHKETRAKLARFIRAPWMRAPLSGRRLTGHLLDALAAMNRSGRWRESSLIPFGQRLDFFASITDLVGYQRPLRLSGSTLAHELEHAVLYRLSHLESDSGESGAFDAPNDPALVWAARASSSYAGAFAPFRHSELIKVLADRNISWDGAERLLRHDLLNQDGTPLADVVDDPATRYYVDGGIVNNKPFSAAMNALAERPADRHVERCIVYIEPNPLGKLEVPSGVGERYLATIASAASAIPRNQPIAEDLESMLAQNERARLNQRIVEENTDIIAAVIARLMDEHDEEPTADAITRLRDRATRRASREMGVAYRAYLQRRVWRLSDALVRGWALLTPGGAQRETQQRNIRAAVESIWHGGAVDKHERRDGFLTRFDVTYRIRRLRFVIRQINLRYNDPDHYNAAREQLDEFKRQTYEYVTHLQSLRSADALSHDVVRSVRRLAQSWPAPPRSVRRVLVSLARELDLDQLDRRYDAAFAQLCSHVESAEMRRALIADYVGFALFDVLLTTGGSETEGPDPLTPVRIERISPVDATTLGEIFEGLQGSPLMSFAGFFNRSYREHDYLWGRLHAADRIVDVLASTVDATDINFAGLRLQLLRDIVRAEGPRLTRCTDLIARINTHLDALSVAQANA